jgi:hypothetical protein
LIPGACPPRDIAAMVKREEADAIALLRSVLGWQGWLVQGAQCTDGKYQVPVLRSAEGHRVLEIFSDREALDSFVERDGDGTTVSHATFGGWQLFGGIDTSSLARISVDLHSPHGFSYQAETVDDLASWVTIARVEAALRDPTAVPQAPLVLLQFARWHVVLRKGRGAAEMVLAPDDQGRVLGAAFSAPDTAQAFVDHATDALPGELVVEVVTGRQLFDALVRMQVDGVVFNPISHLPPRAFDAAMLPRLLALHA